jgi:hypothetical protein
MMFATPLLPPDVLFAKSLAVPARLHTGGERALGTDHGGSVQLVNGLDRKSLVVYQPL